MAMNSGASSVMARAPTVMWVSSGPLPEEAAGAEVELLQAPAARVVAALRAAISGKRLRRVSSLATPYIT
jgi:hypothetical protein